MTRKIFTLSNGTTIHGEAREESGDLYVDEGLRDALVQVWEDEGRVGRSVGVRDDLLVLAYFDGTGPNAHVVEYVDGAVSGWAIPDAGWWPLRWNVTEAPTLAQSWPAQIQDPTEGGVVEFEVPEIHDDAEVHSDPYTIAVWVHRDSQGVPLVNIDTEALTGETRIRVKLNDGDLLPSEDLDARSEIVIR